MWIGLAALFGTRSVSMWMRAGVGVGRDVGLLLQVILRRSFEIVPLMWPPANGPQSVFSELGSRKVPRAVLPCSFVNVTDVPL
jgi:hypothetical protein